MLFAEILSYGELIYFITSNQLNLNLETVTGTSVWQNKLRKKFVINSGVTIGSNSANTAALIIPSGLGASITIVNKGSILGAGGSAGTTLSPNGGTGGAAIDIAGGLPTVYIDNQNIIYSGGGGGGMGFKGNDGTTSSQSIIYGTTDADFGPLYRNAALLTLSHTYNGGLGGSGGSAGRGEGHQQSSTNGTSGLLGVYGSYNSRNVTFSSNAYALFEISIPGNTTFTFNSTGVYTNYPLFPSGFSNVAVQNIMRIGRGCNSSIILTNSRLNNIGINYNSSYPSNVQFTRSGGGSLTISGTFTKDPSQPISGNYTAATTNNVLGGLSWPTNTTSFPPETHAPGLETGYSWVYIVHNKGANNANITSYFYWPGTLPAASRGNDGGNGGNGGAYGQNGQDGASNNPGGGGSGGGSGGLAGLVYTNTNIVWTTVGDRRGRLP